MRSTMQDHPLTITDRVKDVIESGGEWISSGELESEIMAHPDVVEAAVIGIPDERWQERSLPCVVLHAGRTTSAADPDAFLADRVARWWLRARHAEGGLDVVKVARR